MAIIASTTSSSIRVKALRWRTAASSKVVKGTEVRCERSGRQARGGGGATSTASLLLILRPNLNNVAYHTAALPADKGSSRKNVPIGPLSVLNLRQRV